MEQKLKPEKKDRKKFDIDLEYGEIQEDAIANMLQNKKIEVKSERGMWIKTGNIAIEYQSYGKPSGIEATESDYWFHNLCVGEEVFGTLVFEVDKLKKIINTMKSKKSVTGGDHNASRMWLLPLKSLFSEKTIEEFKESE
tara:strand:+ start:260 stop:679 length:420 start_codon:yes stop_codon:yes gene_type:complete